MKRGRNCVGRKSGERRVDQNLEFDLRRRREKFVGRRRARGKRRKRAVKEACPPEADTVGLFKRGRGGGGGWGAKPPSQPGPRRRRGHGW